MTDDLMAQFLSEGRELVAGAERDLATLARRPDDAKALDSCFRAIHTLKGSTGLFDLVPMGVMLHAAEDLLSLLRAERTGVAADFEALFSVVDHVDRWLDALDRTGHLPADAQQIGDVERRRLRELVASVGASAEAASSAAPRTWHPPADFETKGTVAVRYTARADSYFSGDDPVSIIAGLPGLSALRIMPREPWGSLDGYDPYACNLVLEAASTAGRPEIEAALRFVSDQIELADLTGGEPVTRPRGDGARKTLRIDAERVDRLADLADELVIAKNGLADLAAHAERLPGGQAVSQALRGRQAQLDRLVNDLHATVGKVRLVALGPLFGRFHRLTREIANALHKTVLLEVSGGEVEVDKAIVDGLFEPLLHVLRNAIDHGVETAQDRARLGKPPVAVVRLSAVTASDQVVIEVRDDGAGIDPAIIRALAVRRGLLTPEAAEALDDRASIDLIFTPGFSTAAEVSAVSGRGVGMDVVREAAVKLGGKVVVDSQRGQGSIVKFVLPVSMVLTKVMIVTCGAERYGLALGTVVETVRVSADSIASIRAGKAFQLRDDVIPLLALGSLVGAAEPQRRPIERVVVARVQGEQVGFAVDAIVDRMDAAVRPMTGLLAGAPGVMGTTLLADGAVLMILDLAELVL
ncbi:chemotaxis protein CheA [Caulobacter sp. FWC2]|uniref:chemotaxis protein CheA n=1 Tax=Caulobacter sp. FWC2 TaxID=69664 RepID=UPI000C145174|nr:chemotaxis protein CheA [Caulobacter sp. FWC2]PIB92321.1 chemotaxis protein CheA [Caulobacter sp. FWC2]